MHPNAALIERFYTCFQNKDAAGMAHCYHPGVQFSDPVFPDLQGPKAAAMWEMLCERGKDLELEFSGIEADDREGHAHWEARYTFSKTGRKVHNVIEADFEFRDGKIWRHTDRFDLWRWAGMALGLPGKLLGWLPGFQNKIRSESSRMLDAYLRKRSG
jgi:ketosteroid isomerase-like protein